MNFALQTAVDGLSLGSIYALSALGIGLLFGVLRLVNFAHGDFISTGAFTLIVPSTMAAAQPLLGVLPFYVLVPCVAACVVVVAGLAFLLIFRPLKDAPAPILMVASFALSYSVQNSILFLYGSRPKTFNLWPALNTDIVLSGQLRIPLLQVVVVLVTCGMMLGLLLLLRKTRIGVQMRAAAEDTVTSRMLAVSPFSVIFVAMALSGVLASVSSLFLVAQSGVLDYRMGVPLMLFAFVGTVIGGMGNLAGAVFGGFAVGVATIILQAFLPDEIRPYRDALLFGLVFLVLAVKPHGLFPSRHLIERI